MNAKELRRGEVLGRVKRGELKVTEAAELLDVSYRQAKRLKKRYGEGGRQALVHGNVGRASNRADHKRREQVLNQDFHFGPGTVTVYTRAAPNTTSFRAEPCTSPPAAGPKARPSAHRC